MQKKIYLLLMLVILGAFILRFYRVTEIPPSLNWDEVSIGYNAYSVLKTGRDEWGQFLPVHFKAYGEYKLPLQIYTSIPAIAVLGLNDLSVRITPVIYGTLTVLLLFLLTRALFKNPWIGLISAFLLAISPWHLQLTRASFESSFSVFWIVLGFWLLVKGLENQKWLVGSVVAFAVSIYTYNSARVFTPLMLSAIAFPFGKTFLHQKKTLLISIALLGILMLPLAAFVLGSGGNARYKLVSVTDDPGLLPRINENRGNSNLPQPLPRLIHNKITYVSFYVAQHYLAHFNLDFLFISGAPHKQHHVQGVGEMYLFQAPFVLLGLCFLFKQKQAFRWLLFFWILLAFIPVSVTNDSIPHALRTLIAAPAYEILTAFGIYLAYLWLKNKNDKLLIPASLVMMLVVIVSFLIYLNNYYNIYPYKYSRDWQYGYKQAVDYIQDHQNEYDEIIFTRHYGEPHMFTLFYLNYDPAKLQNNPNLVRFETYDWVRVLRFDKFYFPDLGDEGTKFKDILAQNPGKRLLFIGKQGDFPDNIPKLKKISFLDGNPAFEIVGVQ